MSFSINSDFPYDHLADNHVVGNNNTQGINVYRVEQLNIENGGEHQQRIRRLCGRGWDVKHTILVIIVISSIVVMITTISVVIHKCSQQIVYLYPKDHPIQTNSTEKMLLEVEFPPTTGGNSSIVSFRLPREGNYTLNVTLYGRQKIQKMCAEDQKSTDIYTVHCGTVDIDCLGVCDGNCDNHKMSLAGQIQYKIDNMCLVGGGSLALQED